MATASEVEEAMASIETRMAWWELGREGAPPEAVRAMYANLPREVGQACERARKRMGTGYADYLRGLREAQAALAPSARFKEWCAAYGLNYGTVQNQLSQAKKAESKLADNNKLTAPLPKSGKSQLVVQFKSDTERSDTVAGLREVQKAVVGLETDDWAWAVGWLLDFWHEHKDADQDVEGAATEGDAA